MSINLNYRMTIPDSYSNPVAVAAEERNRSTDQEEVNPPTNIAYNQRVWAEIPCTLDELGRVMAYTCDADVAEPIIPFKSSRTSCEAPQTWTCVPSREINLEITKSMRFRVMVNHAKRVAFVVFRCTDARQMPDIDLDTHIVFRAWRPEQITALFTDFLALPTPQREIVALVLQMGGSGFMRDTAHTVRAAAERLLECVGVSRYVWVDNAHPEDPFASVEAASAFVENTVKPWANRKKYKLFVGGYSLGGFIAQYVGIKQQLHNVSFDGLWGIRKFLPSNLDPRVIEKCATIVSKVNSSINWSNEQVGKVYQVSPPNGVDAGQMGYLGHCLNFFYDYTGSLGLQPYTHSLALSSEEIGWMYHVSLNQGRQIKELHLLHNAFRWFGGELEEDSIPGYALIAFNNVSESTKNTIYGEMWKIKGCHQISRHGEYCFKDLVGFSSSYQEKARAIEAYLMQLRH